MTRARKRRNGIVCPRCALPLREVSLSRPVSVSEKGMWEIFWCMECRARWIAFTSYVVDEVRWYDFRPLLPFRGHPFPFGETPT